MAKACTNAAALGAAKGDRVSLGVEAENASSDITATDDIHAACAVNALVDQLLEIGSQIECVCGEAVLGWG